MEIEILNQKVYYEKTGSGKETVILLHGWGQNTSMMSPIAKSLEDAFTVYNLDFPGFGQSEALKKVWGVEEYTKFLREFVLKLQLENISIISHSFGSRVAILYASLYQVQKMVITGGAGILPKRNLAYQMRVKGYKFGKKVLKTLRMEKTLEKLHQNSGSEDYRQLNDLMKKSFIRIVNLDLSDRLELINAPVVLIWGENDEAVPLWMGKKMEALIPDAGLIIFEGQGHYAYYQEISRFNRIINQFLRSDSHGSNH